MKLVSILAATLLLGTAPAATAEPKPALYGYAVDTWRSFTAMLDPRTNLVADNIGGDLNPVTRSKYTSPTNIGGYLWSTVVARDLGIIDRREASTRIDATLDTLARLKKHEPTGMYFNWYDPANGEVLRIWPEDGNPVHPFLSSVDNGWLAAALMVVRTAEPSARHKAEKLLYGMDFGFYYNPKSRGDDFPAGQLRGGFWPEKPPGCSVFDKDVYYTCNHYDILNTEPRIASYIGIALGQIPREHYFGTYRTFPDTCDWSWLKQKPVGVHRSYLGVPVFEGTYSYNGKRFVPTWGGDMFEALMPALFVPEERWAPKSWGLNHPIYVQGQIEHGLGEAKYGYWGFSPASNPLGGYAAYGAPPLGMDPAGYPSDLEGTKVDYGFGECRAPGPAPQKWGDGVVTPHAVFLALPYAKDAALANLAKLKRSFGNVYGPGGFKDSIAVRSGKVADRYLSLDQAMVLGAIGNSLRHDLVRNAFTRGEIERGIRPLLAIEEFSIRRVGT
ncbi:glucoamylase family protein [Kibdelosporangium aridum]|uniref:Uncharacterized protein n=1 Tax=Kibdelosporangium aridum TaxID=2030 RepID=A0A1W2FBY5_KIBAR|nr:glucoamylase family protein [Kibdelosporangium aridum]SMD19076.1 hypothetical protein SAMN05661093_06031 [Kibdelosporangium aridum]